jgi:hypothetical protein
MFADTLNGLNLPIDFGLNAFNGMNELNGIADQDLLLKAAIDPATQWRLATAERLLRDTRGFFPGFGGFLLDGGGSYVVPEETAGATNQQPPQVIVVQAPPAQQPAVQAPSEAAAVTPAPLPDVGSFTLVLHDGKQIQAVAFSRIKDRVAYITPDGGRRTIEAADLDSDATVSVNQDRGTPLQLPR